MLKANSASGSLLTSGLVKETEARRLRILGVATIDDLLGAIRSDAESVSRFVPGLDIPQVQADGYRLATAEFQVSAETRPLAMGALPPQGVDVEQVASSTAFEALVGAAPDVPGRAAVGGDAAEAAPDIRIDLREHFGPVRDQGQRGTCVGHACAAVAEFALRTAETLCLSPQFVYYQAKQVDNLPPDREGTFVNVAMGTIGTVGVCLETLWPYVPAVIPGDFTHGAPPAAAADNAATHRLAGYTDLGRRDTQAIRSALDNGKVVALSIPVYKNWSTNPTVRLDGIIPLPLPTSALDGGHAMCAVGYGYDDDIPGGWFFILRNSWGTQWGCASVLEPGYGFLPFAYVTWYGWEAATFELVNA